MDRGWTRTGLQGSALVDALAGMALLEGPADRPSLVQGLGRWLGWSDAIPLAAALKGAAGTDAPAAGPDVAAAARDVDQVRAALARALAEEGGGDPSTRRAAPRGRAATAPPPDADDFDPQRRRYRQAQQAMDAAIPALRARLRAALARATPPLRRLAALDAALEQALGAREQALLAMMPALLQRHFERRLRAGDPPQAFDRDLHQLLQAELEHRLQPALGLLEALQGGPADA